MTPTNDTPPAWAAREDAADRLIARVLREPPADSLPRQFAAIVAARAEAAVRDAAIRRELRVHLVVLAAIGAFAIAAFGGSLVMLVWQAVASDPASPALRWATTIALCVAATLATEIWITTVRARSRA